MFELFLNPWAMAAGTALVSSPIIIHLINRMRYRRVRWAAMEFLLKSQKKNRRRIIIEQLILLLLRILLVLLAGLLLARFLGAVSGSKQGVVHVVILDDTLSMTDAHREDGQTNDAFRQAKKAIVEEIAQAASQATTAQGMVVFRLSDLTAPRKIERLNGGTVEELKTFLADLECSNLHIDLIQGLDKAQAVFDMGEHRDERKMLHVVSDFRAKDWSGAKAEALREAMARFKATKVDVHFLDAAYPVRSATQKTAVYHDNLAVVDFQPETRVAARFMPVEFSVGVANYSNSERKNVRVNVRVKGQVREEGSFTIPSVPPATVTFGTFLVAFDQLGNNPVSVDLESQDDGLALDNVRYAAVDVREKVPLLLVEGDPKTKGTQDGDGYFLNSLFSESTRGFKVMIKAPADLEKPFVDEPEKIRLEDCPSVFLLNVPRLSDAATAKLETYVRKGGGVAFFMGSEIKPEYYNKLYDAGKGIFPVLLADKPVEGTADPGERFKKMFLNPQQKIYPRNVGHPVFTRIYRDEKSRNYTRENDKYLIFAGIDRYHPVPRSKWLPPTGVIDELMTLPNSRQIGDYSDEANRILREIPVADEQYARFRKSLETHRLAIRNALLQGGELYRLAGPIDALLNDTGVANDPENRPNLQEFWQKGELTPLREQVAKLLEAVRYGDPFLVARTYGKGRSMAYLTTANAAWNDLPNGPARVYFVMLLVEMQKYLSATTADSLLTLGSSLDLDLDATRYDSKMRRFFPPKINPLVKGGLAKVAGEDKGDQVGEVSGNKLTFSFTEARNPGVYEFVMTRKDVDPNKPDVPKGADPVKARQETLAFAFNVDALAESDLRRASKEDLDSVAPNVPLHIPDDQTYASVLTEKKSDLSESIWLFLVFVIVLLVEQAMAVRLSYHTRGERTA